MTLTIFFSFITACAAFLSCPGEVLLVRMSNDITQPIEKRRNYTSVGNAVGKRYSCDVYVLSGVFVFYFNEHALYCCVPSLTCNHDVN